MLGAGMVQGAGARIAPARLIVLLGAPVAVTLASAVYLALMIDDMSVVPGMQSLMMTPRLFDPMQLFGLFLMWTVMMAAMMLPTAAPMLVAYTRMQASDRARGAGWLPVAMFCAGYLVAWAAFSLVAAGLQAGLTSLAMLSPMTMKTISAPLMAGILIGAGAYQFSALKQSCLRQCRTPISFLMTRWRDGSLGGLVMGLRHGVFCVGCCWALMALMFVGGMMNAVWIIAITVYTLIEKVAPGGEKIAKLAGAAMIGAGVWVLI